MVQVGPVSHGDPEKMSSSTNKLIEDEVKRLLKVNCDVTWREGEKEGREERGEGGRRERKGGRGGGKREGRRKGGEEEGGRGGGRREGREGGRKERRKEEGGRRGEVFSHSLPPSFSLNNTYTKHHQLCMYIRKGWVG